MGLQCWNWAGNPEVCLMLSGCLSPCFVFGDFRERGWQREREKHGCERKTRNCSCMPPFPTGDWTWGDLLVPGEKHSANCTTSVWDLLVFRLAACVPTFTEVAGPPFVHNCSQHHLAIRAMIIFSKRMKTTDWIARDQLRLESFKNGLSNFKIYKLEGGMPWLFIVTSALGMFSLNAYKEVPFRDSHHQSHLVYWFARIALTKHPTNLFPQSYGS